VEKNRRSVFNKRKNRVSTGFSTFFNSTNNLMLNDFIELSTFQQPYQKTTNYQNKRVIFVF